ncbi:hypothetical protein [Streptomyces flaveolus]|uniref:hypothetical protein n=1 Tax=Streptomyces flaveolus TaxID=67297 RepID=UPI00378BA79D
MTSGTVHSRPAVVKLRLDPQRIRQVLGNLLTNAAVRTPPGTKVSVTVSVAADAARVTVANSLVRAHGGSLALGGGAGLTEFTVTLPPRPGVP